MKILKLTILPFVFLFFSVYSIAQESIKNQLEKIPGISVEQILNTNFKEYYKVFITQSLDHNNTDSKQFKQRIYIGFNDINAPTIFETDGYGIDYASQSDFIDEPCKLIGGNMIVAEHRYFGKSVPDSLDWNYLSIQQAAADCHAIHELLKNVLVGKWLSTGISKGGQTAIAYKMYYPNDVDACIVYGTPIKNAQFDKRLESFFTSKSDCNIKIQSFQKSLLLNKTKTLPEFEKIVKSKNINFGKIDIETVFDYCVLEYSFSFWQNCFNCTLIPDSSAFTTVLVDELVSVISPRFYSESSHKRNEATFYMQYHELGYYEYNLEPFNNWLKNKEYPNAAFCPKNVKIVFDDSYLIELNAFIKSNKAKNIIFIYGENDPWALVQPDLSNNQTSKKFIVKQGCHKSRISDLNEKQKEEVGNLINSWLNIKFEK